MDATITGLSTDQARYILDTVTGAPAYRVGNEVTVSPEGLDELAALDEHSDGHFDGQYVWIGGTEYAVRGL
jgi:hypothetical protein